MNVAIRVDASLNIGVGHVMRCLTLADELTRRGSRVLFVCRQKKGDLIKLIQEKGYVVRSLPAVDRCKGVREERQLAGYEEWLGVKWGEDQKQTAAVLQEHAGQQGFNEFDWLIVDHYAIDDRWERALRPLCRRIMAIDDLANRRHDCDLLLDQTYGRQSADYRRWIPDGATCLLGSDYALLRPEFLQWRNYSLKRRANPELRRVLISMGGVDPENFSSRILEALKAARLSGGLEITVVMGPTAPCLDEVRKVAAGMPWPTAVKINVDNMAELMADSDLAIGAAGATSWERCCLGLPTIMVVLAENQAFLAKVLSDRGAAMAMMPEQIEGGLAQVLEKADGGFLGGYSQNARELVDGKGAHRAADRMEAG